MFYRAPRRTDGPLSRRFGERAVCLVTVALAVSGGCVAHEAVGRPPTAVEVAGINAYAQAHGDLRLEYVVPLPSCAAGQCGRVDSGRLVPSEISNIIASDARETVVVGQDGERWVLPTAAIAGASVRDRSHGAVVGALIGVAVGVVLTAALVGLSESGAFRDSDPTAPPPSETTAGDVAGAALLLCATQALGWAFWGYVIGGRRSFDFTSASGLLTAGRKSADASSPDMD